jgi:hypothetical protein
VAFIQPNERDQVLYEKIIFKRPNLEPQRLIQTPAHQVRTNVQKDYWTLLEGKPSHIRLKSAQSDLWIQPRRGKFEITEHLQSIEGCEQEILTEINQYTNQSTNRPINQQTPKYIRQEVRWFTATQGSLAYPASTFEAKDATLCVFTLFNHEFPESIPKIAPHSSISADLASWVWQQPLHLTGNVRLFSEKAAEGQTFALADELLFHPSSKKLELRSHVPQKVLLWQNELRLSSPAIEIQRDPIHKTEQIKGIGDVHFYFNGEEEAIFRKIFGIKNL